MPHNMQEPLVGGAEIAGQNPSAGCFHACPGIYTLEYSHEHRNHGTSFKEVPWSNIQLLPTLPGGKGLV